MSAERQLINKLDVGDTMPAETSGESADSFTEEPKNLGKGADAAGEKLPEGEKMTHEEKLAEVKKPDTPEEISERTKEVNKDKKDEKPETKKVDEAKDGSSASADGDSTASSKEGDKKEDEDEEAVPEPNVAPEKNAAVSSPELASEKKPLTQDQKTRLAATLKNAVSNITAKQFEHSERILRAAFPAPDGWKQMTLAKRKDKTDKWFEKFAKGFGVRALSALRSGGFNDRESLSGSLDDIILPLIEHSCRKWEASVPKFS